AITLNSAKQRCNRSAVSSCRFSIAQPLLRVLCQTSIPQRPLYHLTSVRAPCSLSIRTVVSNSHSSGSTPGGGCSSTTHTTPTLTAANCSLARYFGGLILSWW